ncbi:hypothetical protein [Brevibacterium samyangense]|uniref:Squalene cyclase C-terminal domain-containing protein n=1 Tax=Brevibacterium samyangense TaxID=366888 RepID=A0ABN2TGH4_9MICO
MLSKGCSSTNGARADAGGTASTRAARTAGEDYLLERRVLHRLTDDSPIVPWQTVFAYPPRAAYSALRVFDHFRAADEVASSGSLRGDDHLTEAVELVRSRRKPDGTWHQDWRHGGKMWFEVDVPPGHPSPWLTFRALRVLRWWDNSTG